MRNLVVVSGPVASGKSTLATPLAERLGLPLVAKDTIKEALFDVLGTGDEAWSKRMGAATYAVLWALAPGFPAAVLEANFGPEARDHLLVLCPHPIQVHCTGPREELERRFNERPRHPGHIDEFPADKVAEQDALDLGGPRLVVDTTDSVDIDAVVAWVGAHIGDH